jgi:hypothetical protein
MLEENIICFSLFINFLIFNFLKKIVFKKKNF